jgi:SAM-dependent methyltransferase
MTHSTRIDSYEYDCTWTLRNRENLFKNSNLLAWYQKLYARAFSGFQVFDQLKVLEIGSGSSPLQHFYSHVITSDILPLDHVDLVLDCHKIHNYNESADASLDIITMTNVLHHLHNPVDFMDKAAKKIKPGGWIIAIEPYFSHISRLIYKLLHHEPSDFTIEQPLLSDIKGPLSSANMALPQLLFLHNKETWLQSLEKHYQLQQIKTEFFTSLAYMATGGISRSIPIPQVFYRNFLNIDTAIADAFPRWFASFMILKIQKRS